MDKKAWEIVVVPGHAPDDYQRALRLITNAREVDQQGAFESTLAVAQYRVGRYEEALATLLAFNATSAFGLKFIAMSQWQLGQRDEARQTLERLREWMQRRRSRMDDADAKRFLREAEELIEGQEQGNGKREQSAVEPAEP